MPYTSSLFAHAHIKTHSITSDMIGETGMVDNFDVSLSSSFIIFFLMKLELSETSKLSTIPVSLIMSLFNQFSTRLVLLVNVFSPRMRIAGKSSIQIASCNARHSNTATCRTQVFCLRMRISKNA